MPRPLLLPWCVLLVLHDDAIELTNARVIPTEALVYQLLDVFATIERRPSAGGGVGIIVRCFMLGGRWYAAATAFPHLRVMLDLGHPGLVLQVIQESNVFLQTTIDLV